MQQIKQGTSIIFQEKCRPKKRDSIELLTAKVAISRHEEAYIIYIFNKTNHNLLYIGAIPVVLKMEFFFS